MPLEKLLQDRSKSQSKKVKYGTGKKKHLKKNKKGRMERKVPFSPSSQLPATLMLVCFGSIWWDGCAILGPTNI